jgi:hypothetical protein
MPIESEMVLLDPGDNPFGGDRIESKVSQPGYRIADWQAANVCFFDGIIHKDAGGLSPTRSNFGSDVGKISCRTQITSFFARSVPGIWFLHQIVGSDRSGQSWGCCESELTRVSKESASRML